MAIICEYTGKVDFIHCCTHDAGNSIMGLLFTDDPSEKLVICPDSAATLPDWSLALTITHRKSVDTLELHDRSCTLCYKVYQLL